MADSNSSERSSKSRAFDVVIFGCTGLVGRLTLQAMVKLAAPAGLKVAAAGRNEERMKQIISDTLDEETSSSVGYIVADAYDYHSIQDMAKSTRLVLNCAGPFTIHGEVVVRACVEAGTDYMDTTGEINFAEAMQLKYSAAAKASGAIIISSCAFDAVPGDLGVQIIHDLLSKNERVPYSVEAFLEIVEGPSGYTGGFGTFQSLLLAISNMSVLKKIRQELRSSGQRPELKLRGPKFAPHRLPFIDSRAPRGIYVPFVGPTPSVVLRSQQLLTRDNTAYTAVNDVTYMKMPPGILTKMGYAFFGMICLLLSTFEVGRKLLLKFPEAFTGGKISRKGPTQEQMNTTFYKISFIGSGYANEKALESHPSRRDVTIRGSVTGPDPGYNATSGILATLGYVLLTERDKVSAKSGGVYTPATVFRGTSAAQKLTEGKFAVYSDNMLN
ncbi:hypothetical protein FOZ61_001777 [Perkinsus olseni]|uniref:Saccharopine dehydrogenase NADP binding domain-containing protein n=1 Tax=Perkinsus olseni TaxID=32597 RepID=A0A7J6LVH4_PEROL|nr:hypothetical protein FOZ61_001777 [Perkinsus olseni]KAF4668992.1 hypothetical protein FOL46_001673 [Perkinsus olseni]